MENSVVVCKNLLKQLNIKYTTKYLKNTILSHQDHTSLVAIMDTLEKYKIETLAIKVDIQKLEELPLPSVVQFKTEIGMELFVLVGLDKNNATYLNHLGKKKHITISEFNDMWTGVCLLVEKTEDSKEQDIEKKIWTRKIFLFLKVLITSLIISWIGIEFYRSEVFLDSNNGIYVLFYTIVKLIGIVIGSLLLWFEIDEYNPTLQSFCSGTGKKIDCNAVLNSKYATLFNGNLSLSLITFSYFFGSLIYLIISGFTFQSITILNYLSFSTLPFVVMSLYYQAIIIKQWCKFCIIAQLILLIEITLSIITNSYQNNINIINIPLLLALFLIPIIIWKALKPLLEKEKEIYIYQRGLKKIKENPNVLNGLLSKARKINTPTEGLGILFKNENAKYDVVKVCNPYCGPCAKAHPKLEELVKKGKINLRILFATSQNIDDPNTTIVKHFLALDDNSDKEKTKKALDNWYTSEKKDYQQFLTKYPMNGELEKQGDKITAMYNWCRKEKITHTPSIFINGFELPEEYQIEDLQYVLV